MTHSRPLAGLMVGLVALLLTGAGPAALAAVPLPDPVGSAPQPQPPFTMPPPEEMTVGQEIAWMLSGAAVVLLAIVVVLGIAVLLRRHSPRSRRLQVP